MFFSLTLLYAIWWISFVINKKITFYQNAKKINCQYYIKNYIWKNGFDDKNKIRKKILKHNREKEFENKIYDTHPNSHNNSNVCRNEYYKGYIEKIYNDLNNLDTKNDIINYIINVGNKNCKDYYIPIDKTKFTSKNIFNYTKKQKFYINELGDNSKYVYINKCNSNVYLGVNIERCCFKNEEIESICQGIPNKICKLKCSEILLSNSEEINEKTKILELLKMNDISGIKKIMKKESLVKDEKIKYYITIDGCSDNIVLNSFIYILLKGINKLDLHFFLNIDFKKIANDFKNMFEIHFNTEHIVNHIYKRICKFFLKINKTENLKKEENTNINQTTRYSHTMNKLKKKNIPSNFDINKYKKKLYFNKDMKIYCYPKVAHMLSGGIDSLMALILLEKKKFYIDNFYFNFTYYNCSKNDLKYVKNICKNRNNLHIININKEYYENVFLPMLRSYSKGQVPNPDIVCNKKIKYNFFLKTIKSMSKLKGKKYNYSYISTGHYAMISTNNPQNCNNIFNNNFPYIKGKMENKDKKKKERCKLIVSSDLKKDQTFFLSSFSEKQLSKFLFPLSLYNKNYIRMFMKKNNITNYNPNETKGLCLYGNVDMHSLLKLYFKTKEYDGAEIDGIEKNEAPQNDGKKSDEKNVYNNLGNLSNSKRVDHGNGAKKGSGKLNMEVLSVDLYRFKKNDIKNFNLNYVNYIIDIDDEIVMEKNSDIHLYTIGQNKHITTYIHDLYIKRFQNKKNEKNIFSSCQWTVVYKKILPKEAHKNGEKKIIENFIYVTKNYSDNKFAILKKKCKLKNIKWIEKCDNDDIPIYLKKKKNKDGKIKNSVIIFVKIRNNEKIKKANLIFNKNNNEGYLELENTDIGLSPGQIITFYLPFIVKKKSQTQYIYNIDKYLQFPIYYHCIGNAKITNQYLNIGIYKRIMEIHKKNNLTSF
ncbi:tRNA methyltransferase, putative [Plasmodium berghei]|uniref:tRNA methyltransferase, putative n=2 Tax=Plasmodium berghei TaxID=5821 RepID=A0A509AGS5_PLABA|nr:tRNA methyltransferase, putative [Plasmodium berghei ANKA]CXI07479.1 tRNA methyltransferase, putative [Plasmodium berghei]SCL92607.1 tRNA methyltransferase, putative [Plasmodium berghei]SCM15676.1 tRNA methyltransferase, putative [Plasmodium berghei]SCM17470.1 tRNA methyltransferase, putative [Plasmodium berghei]SCN22831.1 tRNA methyltransferase, putative [Plasmodium berghei]|eukprot:XP_034420281.1 tRNA methyltransferase, putative [Plasmodium berghei ANKA]